MRLMPLLICMALSTVLSLQEGGKSIATPSRGPRFVILGPEETVFAQDSQACDDLDFPDAPARAIRIGKEVRLFASHYINRSFVGPSLRSVKRNCVVSYRGGENPDPWAYDDFSWIATPFIVDNLNLIALVHTEYQGHRYPGRCAFSNYFSCWMNSLQIVTSDDGGAHFVRDAGANSWLVGLPYRYDPQAGVTTGYMNPSNIVERDGYYYFIAWAAPYKSQLKGNCIFRSKTPSDAKSWRAWDGQAFDTRFINPYTTAQVNPADHVCRPVDISIVSGPAMSLTFNQVNRTYFLLFFDREKSGNLAAYFAYSTDIIHWTPGGKIFDLGGNRANPCGARDYAYPSLIDENSSSPNFETITDSPYLYLTKSFIEGCARSSRRDLVRYKVHIEFAK
jgi:hypothetical protein